MAFIITADHINAGDDRRVGVIGPSAISSVLTVRLKAGEGQRFRLIDDDNCLCYEGKFLDGPDVADEFQPLDCFGMPDAGCTRIDYWEPGKGGGWKPL